MADAQVFSISAKSAKGYNFLPGRMPNFRRNGAGVTAIMGLSNGRGAASRAKAQGDNEMFEDYDFGEEAGYEPNARRRRRRRKTAGKRRRVSRTRARARRTTRRSRRRVASRSRRMTRGRRRVTRGRRRVTRGRRRVTRGRRRVTRGRRRVTRGRRGYRRNGYMENSDFMDNADVGSWGSIGGDFDRVGPKGKSIKYVAGSSPFGASPVATRKGRMIRGFSGGIPKHRKTIFVAAGGGGGRTPPWQPPAWDFPWDPTPSPKEKKPKYPAEVRDYLRRGIKPKHLFKAMEDMTREQIDTMFPDYRAYRRFMRHATRDRKFRRYRSRYFSSARYGSARSRTNKIARRIAAKLTRRAKGRRRKGRRYSGTWRKRLKFLKKSYSRKSYRRRPRYMGWSRKRKSRGRKSYRKRFPYAFRPNFDGGMFDFAPNVPYSDTKELLLAGLCAVGGYAVPQLVGGLLSKYVHPYAGAAGAVVAGGATVYLSKHIDNDAYAKGAAIGGLLGVLAGAAISAAMIYQKIKAPAAPAAGFGVAPFNTTARYVPMGQFHQAAAGQFQQAAAGEYLQGSGEYYSPDNSLSPVSDFGEYVSSGLSVQGYADYEVMPQGGSVDGMGYVSDGVYPNSDLDQQFNIMEAAAGLGNMPHVASDYIPTVYSQPVGSHGSQADTGIFDVGGSNGVFG